MAATVGDFLLQRLSEWGVHRIYGYPGDGINGIMGAIHLLNGLYDAKLDHQPVVAIVGQQKRAAFGGDYQQEVDLISLFKDVAHEFVHMVSTPEQMRHLVDRAMRIARDQRTVTCIIIPNDVQELPAVPVPPREHGTVHSGMGYTAGATVPSSPALARAAEILSTGKKVAILVGAGALHATDEVLQTANLLGKAAVPDDVPFVTGTIGLLGTKPSRDMMNDCDTLLIGIIKASAKEWWDGMFPPSGKQ